MCARVDKVDRIRPQPDGGAIVLIEDERTAAAMSRVAANARGSWTSVSGLSARAGEVSRPRGGRWIAVPEMPVPFAIRLASGDLAKPARLAQRIVAGQEAEGSLATEAPE